MLPWNFAQYHNDPDLFVSEYNRAAERHSAARFSLPKDFFVGFMLQFHWLVCRGMRLWLPALKQDQRKKANFSIVCPTFHVDSVGHFLRVHTIG